MEEIMGTQTRYKSYPYTGEADLEAIVALINACDEVDKFEENQSVDSFRVWFDHPHRDKARDVRLWRDEEGELRAMGMLMFPPDEHEAVGHFYWQVHPQARGSGLEDEVITWAEDVTREVAKERGLPGVVRPEGREGDPYHLPVLERHGYTPIRYFFLMRRSLDEPIPEPRFPEGFTLTHLQSDEDVPRWVEMFNLSFIDHFEHHDLTVERRKQRMAAPGYRRDRDLIAVAPDGTFAAFCLCDVDAEYNERNDKSEGWIAVLGTRRGYRKIGLGRAMLLAGLHQLKSEGLSIAALGVDAENPTGALGLYESTGFYRDKTGIAYRKEVAGS
jgi:mycothiol synthase